MAKIDPEFVNSYMIPHLQTQFERAQIVLFTGAGFSVGARNMLGETLPGYRELVGLLWPIAMPGEDPDPNASLPDTFFAAVQNDAREVKKLMQQQFSVDYKTLPDWYEIYFKLSWVNCYTLNVDNLDIAVGEKWDLPRRIHSISATNTEPNTFKNSALDVVHLHGALDDVPDYIIFSTLQYATAMGENGVWYSRVVADLLSRPFIFVGTSLDEPSLWEYMAKRGSKTRRNRSRNQELRPRSYLVSPSISRVRESLLDQFNIKWIPMNAEQFAHQILQQLIAPSSRGIQRLNPRNQSRHRRKIADVASIAVHPERQTEFLLGEEPEWSDIQTGRAANRAFDDSLWEYAVGALKDAPRKIILIGGTAGSGKSTSLMRLCLRFSAEGKHVGWIDRNSEFSGADIVKVMRDDIRLEILAIDDADMLGSTLSATLRDLVDLDSAPMMILAMRSGKINRCINPNILRGITVSEKIVPDLSDSDIDGLIESLDNANRLGKLKGKSQEQRRIAFREKAGRQLLVAMIEVTFGVRFEDKAIDELTDLGERDISAVVYGLVAVASYFRSRLSVDEIMLALDDTSNVCLNRINELVRRRIVVRHDSGQISTRHRVIAEVIFDRLAKAGQVRPLLEGLSRMLAAKISPATRNKSRERQLMIRIINHDFLLRTIQFHSTRSLYAELEDRMDWDYHYWLQRGSAEVEEGDIALAENFLSQALSLAPGDRYVRNEYAYLLFSKALAHPNAAKAGELVDQATAILEKLIQDWHQNSAHPYHVLCRQGLSWSRVGIPNSRERSRYLTKLRKYIKMARERYPRDQDIQQLALDVEKVYLEMAIPERSRS